MINRSRVAETQNNLLVESRASHKMTVASVNWKGHLKRLRLEPGPRWLDVPRSACLTTGDQVIQEDSRVWVPCDNGMCQVLPAYASPVSLKLGGLTLDVLIKEITEAYEHTAYEYLADLHYRGHTVHGRTARLIVRTFDPAYPQVIGFIELATPFFMNKARARVLDAPFELDGVAWDSWDIHTLRQNIHRIVRIARTVVSPEFRGFGIGRLLVEQSAVFARDRWQVAGKMPYFLEIAADMLKFVPFVQQAGMRYVGETDGNLSRVAKDMSYLIGRFGDGAEDTNQFERISGILDQQVARMNRSLSLMKERNFEATELTKRLARLSAKSVLKDFDLFRGIVSLPKPTFMMGLNESASKFIDDRLEALRPGNPIYRPRVKISPIEAPLRVSKLAITYLSRVRRTLATHAIQQAFDISPTDIRTTAVYDLSFELAPGEVLLIEGPSGSGKTTLIEALVGQVDSNRTTVEGSIDIPKGFHPSSFKPIRSRKSLIELFAGEGIREALHYLGLAGLSEPFLYLKRFDELSRGQQYRAMLAQMLSSGRNVWIADEFCANLDEITANLVAYNVQKIARQYGATVIAAASNTRPFVRSLNPDHVIRLSSSSQSSVVTGSEYVKMLRIRMRRGVDLPRLAVDSDSLVAARDGRKHATIRRGRKQIQEGLVILANRDDSELARVTRCTQRRFNNLTEHDAMLDGFSDLAQLKAHVKSADPTLADTDFVTVVEFVLPCGEVVHRD